MVGFKGKRKGGLLELFYIKVHKSMYKTAPSSLAKSHQFWYYLPISLTYCIVMWLSL